MKLKASVFPLKNQIVSIIMFHLKSHKMMVWHEFSIWKGNYIGSPHFWDKPNQWMQESRLPRQRKLREAVPDNPCTVYLPAVTPRITANICKICCIVPAPLMVICQPMSSPDNDCWPTLCWSLLEGLSLKAPSRECFLWPLVWCSQSVSNQCWK
jgi:hypothetical protein